MLSSCAIRRLVAVVCDVSSAPSIHSRAEPPTTRSTR